MKEELSVKFRVLKKRCQKFDEEIFFNWKGAFDYAIDKYKAEFRIFEQRTYEWCESLSTEIIKVNKL